MEIVGMRKEGSRNGGSKHDSGHAVTTTASSKEAGGGGTAAVADPDPQKPDLKRPFTDAFSAVGPSVKKSLAGPISMKFGVQVKSKNTKEPSSTAVKTSFTVSQVFNDDDDEDSVEEMPPEAKMRMRNLGRDTPTSAGPNSFGKTKHGFCYRRRGFDKDYKGDAEKSQKPSQK